jgi:hypothetical protein
MTDMASPVVMAGDKTVTQLRQVTVTTDEGIAQVNELLRDGWKLVSVGFHTNATVYVLGRMDEKPRHRPGFLGAE